MKYKENKSDHKGHSADVQLRRQSGWKGHLRFRMLTSLLSTTVLLAVLSTACDSSVLYDEHYRVEEKGWNMTDSLVFNIETEDTAQSYMCCIDIRNKNDYAYSNIYFYINTIYPNGEVAVDTNIEFQLAMPDGQWLGKESGGYVDGRYPLGYIRFPEKGKYQFVIKHAMRDTALAGIKDVGMHIEKM